MPRSSNVAYRFLNSVWILCNNFDVHYFQFSHCRKPNVPSSSQVRKTNVNKQRLFLALGIRQTFCRCFCWWRRSHRCFTGKTISRFSWFLWLQRWQSGLWTAQWLRYASTQTHRHADGNTSNPYPGRSKKRPVLKQRSWAKAVYVISFNESALRCVRCRPQHCCRTQLSNDFDKISHQHWRIQGGPGGAMPPSPRGQAPRMH